MRTEYINSLVVYFDDDEIGVLCTLSEKLKRQCNQVGLKRPFTSDEAEVVDRIYNLFDHKKQEKTTADETTHEVPGVGANHRGKVR